MAEEKKSFVLYCDYREHLTLLSDSECGQLFKAIFDYQNDGILPSLSPAAQMAFSFIKAQLDKDAEKYAETVRQRSEAGKKSAAAKKQNQQAVTNGNEQQQKEQTSTNSTNANEPQQTSTNTNEAQQTLTNSTDNVNVNDNDSVTVFDNNPTLSPQGGECGGNQSDTYSERFKEFWAAYPKKIGKDAALKAFKKRKPSAELLTAMITAIEKQKRSAQWTKDNGQYIPNPATWLNQGRWEDELPEQPQNMGNQNTGNRQQTPPQGSRNPFINAVMNGGGTL